MYPRKYLLLLIVILFLSACSKPEPEPKVGLRSTPPPTYVSTMPNKSVIVTADKVDLMPGDSITISWTSADCEDCRAQIILIIGGSSAGSLQAWNDLPPIGTLQTKIEGAEFGDRYRFIFFMHGKEAMSYSTNIDVRFPCSADYFFDQEPQNEDVCPASEPIYSLAIEQVFEGGRVFWLQSDNSLYVLYNESEFIYRNPFTVYKNSAPIGKPTLNPMSAPYQLVRWAGNVWGKEMMSFNIDGDAIAWDKLGRALSAEQTFISIEQGEWITCPKREGCVATSNRYIRLSDGRLIILYPYAGHGSSPHWEYHKGRRTHLRRYLYP